jgi:hypothetical protein
LWHKADIPDASNEWLLLGVRRTSGGGRFSFICAPLASRGHADERVFHLLPDALHGAGAYAEFAGNLVDAFILVASIQRQRLNVLGAARPTGRKPDIWLPRTRKLRNVESATYDNDNEDNRS